MNHTPKRAILAVSFGTSFEETKKKTIDRIEDDIHRAYPDDTLYRAWTSQMILRKILKRDNLHIFNIREAMEQMIRDGITELVVQPTHVISGIENDSMKEDVLSYTEYFDRIAFGAPLLTSEQDHQEAIRAMMNEWTFLPENEVLVLMGHGTTHHANAVYAALDHMFKDMGYNNVFLGTVEAYPSMDFLLEQVMAFGPRKVHLAPFMIVAGDHARNDMAGDDPDSWYSRFVQTGLPVECHLKGLGEYEGIRRIFLRHIAESRCAFLQTKAY